MANVSKAALPALWKADPGFVQLAKYLYGEDVTVEEIAKDLFGKGDPGQSDVHVNKPLGKQKPPLPKNTDEETEETEKRFYSQRQARAAFAGAFKGVDKDKAKEMADSMKTKKNKHPIKRLPETTSKSMAVIAKSFFDLVEKAYDEGLIDGDGNLNEIEIEKSRQYVRDHAGRFAGQGKHTARNVGGVLAAGALAGGGAALAAKSPGLVRYAGDATKFVAHHLKSKDPVERHVARALLPHALKASGKAVATAGTGAVTSAGAVYEGTQTYQRMRHQPHVKAARYEEVSKLPLSVGAKYVNTGARALEHVRGYGPRHARALTKGKKLRRLVADKSEDAIYNPTKPLQTVVDMTKRADRQYHRDNTGRFAAGGVAGLAAVGGASEGAGRLAERRHQGAARDLTDSKNMWQDLSHGSQEYAQTSGSRTAMSQAHDFAAEAGKYGEEIGRHLKQGKAAAKLGRKGAIGAGVAAGALGYGALIHHENQRYKRGVKAARHDVVWAGDISKVDDAKRQVFGWASVTELDGKPVVDLQGDYIHPDEVEKAAYDYVVNSRVGGDMHYRVDENGNIIEKLAHKPHHVSDLIESMVFTPEKCEAMGISKSLAGRWWTGFQINDPDVWEDVKTGKRTGFSIHGVGLRKNIEPEEIGLEQELVGKAWDESDSPEEFAANLQTLANLTGYEPFNDIAKHLAHGVHTPQINAQQSRNAGVYGSASSAVGGITGGLIGAKFGHAGEGAGIGAGVGGVAGTALGVHAGSEKHMPQRPASIAHIPHGATKAARYSEVGKDVGTTNRMGGAPASRQNMYQQYALQQATEQLAPQVAQHLQALQEQRWQQQMIEQQQMQMMAQQQGQDFAVQMGPYANQPSQRGQTQHQNPLAPSQQPNQQNQTPTAPQGPSGPSQFPTGS